MNIEYENNQSENTEGGQVRGKKFESVLTPKQLIARYEKRYGDRGVWQEHWQELEYYTVPRKANVTVTTFPGTKRGQMLFDGTAMHSSDLLAGALHGMLTNPYSKFFDLATGIPEIDLDDECRIWMEDSTNRMHNVINESNFQTEIHETYIDIVSIGTNLLMMEEDDDYVVRFSSKFIKYFFCEENKFGIIDDVIRHFHWRANKIVETFGYDNMPKAIQKAYDSDDQEKFSILHGIYPKKVSDKKFPYKFVSQYVIKDYEKQVSLKGFHEFPYAVPRWTKNSDETYGRSPAMNALPEAKTVNKMKEMQLIAAQKITDPPLLVPDDGVIGQVKTKPGGLTYYRSGSQDEIRPLYTQQIDIKLSDSELEDHRQKIKDAFFIDQLQLNKTAQMTATEVNAIVKTQMRLLGPVMGRLQTELLQPLIARLFGIMNRRQMFKPMPAKMRAAKHLIARYTSFIARAQKIDEVQNINMAIDAMTPFYKMNPQNLDWIDAEYGVKYIAGVCGLPQKMIRTKKDVDKMRAQQAKQQAKAAQQQEEQHQADVAQKTAPAIQAMGQIAQNQNQGAA